MLCDSGLEVLYPASVTNIFTNSENAFVVILKFDQTKNTQYIHWSEEISLWPINYKCSLCSENNSFIIINFVSFISSKFFLTIG